MPKMGPVARGGCKACSCLILVTLLLCIVSIAADSTLRLSRAPPLINGYNQQASKTDMDTQNRLRVNRALKTAPAASWRGMIETSQPIRRALYFWSRAGPIVAHYRFTQWWIQKYPKEDRDQIYERLHNAYCQPSLQICLHLQGLFTKIGQVLSARPDFVPHQYVELFATVQDSVPQWPYEQVRELVCTSLRENQGLEWSNVFEHMDEKALGSASIGQCHRAILKSPWNDHYKTVAVKIMHPGAQKCFRHDFQIFRWLCRIALPGWTPILDELQKQMMTEFDYRQEARNLDEVRDNMMRSPYKNQVTVPEPLHELCSQNMLVMEMLEGKKFADAMEDRLADAIGSQEVAKKYLRQKRAALVMGNVPAGGDSSDASELIAFGRTLLEQKGKTSLWSQLTMGYRLVALHRHVLRSVQLLVDVHGYQIFLNRVFNGDCHPGNMLELPNGKIGLIDYGQTKRLSLQESRSIARVVSEIGRESIDKSKVAAAMRDCGFQTKWDKDDVLTMYAKLFFDSDDEAKAQGCATPQLYLMKLASLDPLLHVPDASIFVARTSYLFRGMGSMAGDQIRTSKYWRKHAEEALQKNLP
jgi:aarF domain-containing kinase